MNAVADWINRNLGPSLIAAVAIGFLALWMALQRALRRGRRSMERALAESERRRERDGARWVARVQEDGERTAAFMQRLYELQAQSQQSSEARIARLSEAIVGRQDSMQRTLNERLQSIQGSNDRKLDQMREMVGQKLTSTLERRLGESFKRVSDQLESVHKGLGEMQALASGVGDLKRVLTGVKTRGVWGEVRLGALLEQNLAPGQYVQNAQIGPDTQERVEYALALPGKGEGGPVLLPIDSKFPQEDYQRLLDAAEANDVPAIARAGAALERAVNEQAKRIAAKYIKVPHSTDFAILFLPSEGLYAEVLRRPGLVESVQQKHRVVLSGPTTLSALLSSLQMGFRTLAVERRSEEAWRLLGAVREEFWKFGEVLDKTRQRLDQASSELDNASVRTRAINRRLSAMEQLGSPDDPESPA